MKTFGESNWTRHLFYRIEVVKTTWKLRLALLFALVSFAVITQGFWSRAIAESLVHTGEIFPSEMIVVENFDPNYLLFERGKELFDEGFCRRVAVPVCVPVESPGGSSPVHGGIAEVMARVARLDGVEMIPIREIEPITLNTALQVRNWLLRNEIDSVLFVSDGFRSKRSYLVYDRILRPAGIRFHIVPVFGLKTPENWTATWHGIQEVVLEFGKLWYYRLEVLPWGNGSLLQGEVGL